MKETKSWVSKIKKKETKLNFLITTMASLMFGRR